jgi:hypothetical protein
MFSETGILPMVLLYVGYVIPLCPKGILDPSKLSQVWIKVTVTKPVSFKVQRLGERLETENVAG